MSIEWQRLGACSLACCQHLWRVKLPLAPPISNDSFSQPQSRSVVLDSRWVGRWVRSRPLWLHRDWMTGESECVRRLWVEWRRNRARDGPMHRRYSKYYVYLARPWKMSASVWKMVLYDCVNNTDDFNWHKVIALFVRHRCILWSFMWKSAY